MKLKEIIALGRQYLPEFLAKYEAELGGRKGCYLALRRINSAYAGGVLGSFPSEEAVAQKTGFAHEKVNRHMLRWSMGHPDRTTFPTQNYALQEFGGGVRTENLLFVACSGFPPYYDTLFVVELLQLAKIIDDIEAAAILAEAVQYQNTGVE